MGRHRTLRRITITLALAVVCAGAFVAGAHALKIANNTPCPEASGPRTNTCPPGTVGVPYSIRFEAEVGSGCGPDRQTFAFDAGALPPGLSIGSSGIMSGTPTTVGTYRFYVRMNTTPPFGVNCTDEQTEKEFTLVVNPGAPALQIGPDVAPPGTVGTSYLFPMTTNLDSPTMWTIVGGSLPPGLELSATSGVISGTPTSAGTFSFVISAAPADGRTATKALSIEVKTLLAVVPPDAIPRSEVGVPVRIALGATGGTPGYTWSLTAGALPDGVALTAAGLIVGRPLTAGIYRFTASVADTGGQVATFAGALKVAARLTITGPAALRPGVVGRPYRARIAATGGVAPRAWRVAGRLPRGVRFDRRTAVLAGIPRTPGRFRVVFEVTDQLGVKSKRSYLIRIAPAKKR